MSVVKNTFRLWSEFLPAWLLLNCLSVLPRPVALCIGRLAGWIGYHLIGRLRRIAYRNLQLAMPELSRDQQRAVVKEVFQNLGRLLGEFSQFNKIDANNVRDLVVYEGFDNYARAVANGRGLLFLTGHLGAWELCAFAHGAFGYPLSFLVRPIDNHLVEKMINRFRRLSGNRTIDKNNSVRSVLQALKKGEAVGFLIDVNTLNDQGVFCDFFGMPACSSTGLAVLALRSEAPVVPGFLVWDGNIKKHRLEFGPEVQLIRTGDFKEEVQLNTAQFTRIIETYIRRYPGQWLWIHRRWKTRPEGDPDLYAPRRKQSGGGQSMEIKAPIGSN